MRPTHGPWTSSLFSRNGATTGRRASRSRATGVAPSTGGSGLMRVAGAGEELLALRCEHRPERHHLRLDRLRAGRPRRRTLLHPDAGSDERCGLGVDRLGGQLAEPTSPARCRRTSCPTIGMRVAERRALAHQVLGQVGRCRSHLHRPPAACARARTSPWRSCRRGGRRPGASGRRSRTGAPCPPAGPGCRPAAGP